MNLFSDLKMDLSSFLSRDTLNTGIKVALYVIVGLLVIRIIIFIFKRTLRKKLSSQSQMLISKAIMYVGLGILILVVLRLLGISLATLLGAAGIVGIAIGISSQTSLSNIISGLFLLSEKPFEVGDVIRVGDKTGIIDSIDLMSTKIRTFDNLFIRIPNEAIIKTEVTNITRYPIRRMDFSISVAYKEDIKTVKELLKEIAHQNPLCLEEPEPLILYKEFGQSGIEILFGIWFEKANFVQLKNEIFETIHSRFKTEGIEIPFPHISLHTGSDTKPFPISLQG